MKIMIQRLTVPEARLGPLWLSLAAPLWLWLGLQAPATTQGSASQEGASQKRPNVLIVMADDMGYGDLSMAGNPDVSTPQLDAMATRSAKFTSFYVSPVCGLTRAALLTGRYPHRVGVHLNGRNLEQGTPTLASDLQAAGYATGIFGKWHLGDHYPYRPVDFGFEKSVVSRGGVLGQLADRPNLVRYTDPFLMNDGRVQAFQGYATDVHFDQALGWIEAMHAEGRPFFALLAPNAPHKPYSDVPMEAYQRLKLAMLSKANAAQGEGLGLDQAAQADLDDAARHYAMVERIDENIGRMFERLERNGLLDQTLVLFFSDNGPVPGHFNAGLRGGKGHIYEGGIKTHFFAHFPGKLSPETSSDRIAAHIDLLPTLLEACNVELTHQVDGVSLWPLLTGADQMLPERLLFFEARQDNGAARQNYAVRSQQFKLVMPGGYGGDNRGASLELYDLQNDALESKDLAAFMPEQLQLLERAFEPYAEELKAIQLAVKRNELRIEVGAQSDHPQLITRPHWKRTDSGNLNSIWQILVTDPGTYQVRLRYEPAEADRISSLRINKRAQEKKILAGEDWVIYSGVQLIRGASKLECDVADERGYLTPAWQMELIRTGELEVAETVLPKAAGRNRGALRFQKRGQQAQEQDEDEDESEDD